MMLHNEEANARSVLIYFSIVLGAFLLLYFKTILGLVSVWETDEDYSYGYLIPFVCGYLVWERRKELSSLADRVKTNWIGFFFFLLFLTISAYGILGSSPSAVRPAMPLVLLSVILFCLGKQIFKLLFLPAAFSIFMIPLPTIVEARVTVPLKMISTKLGELLLRLFDVSVFVQGNVIDLGVTQLQVVDACSGLRYVIPLLALGILYAYFFEKSRWKQFLMVASTVFISILTNGLRIGATGILTQYYGSEVAEGFFHGFSGWLIFMFAFGVLVLLHLALKMIPGEGEEIGTADEPAESVEEMEMPSVSFSRLPFIVTASMLTMVGLFSFSTSAMPAVELKDGFSSFPMKIGRWVGVEAPVDQAIVDASGAEEAFNAVYRDEKGQTISLYIGYRSLPFGESENFFHSPNICLPSSGWKTVAIEKHSIQDVVQFGELPVQKMIIEQMNARELVYYWFQTNRYVSHNVNINRFDLTLHAIQRMPTHDLFVRPIMRIQDGKDPAVFQSELDQFVRVMMDVLMRYLTENQITDVK